MAKVRTFSRQFPAYHPQKGEPTFFVEKILNTLGVDYQKEQYFQELLVLNAKNMIAGKLSYLQIETFFKSLQKTKETKQHTIRNGNSIKKGEPLSMRVWSSKPYNSPQIIFYNTMVVKTYHIEVCTFTVDRKKKGVSAFLIDGVLFTDWQKLAQNDGLTQQQITDWFLPSAPFNGQIISWDPAIKY